MKVAPRRGCTGKRKAEALERLQRALVGLHDELTETMARTAFVCDGVCGILAESGSNIDPATCNGMRFVSMSLKERNAEHAATLQEACRMLRKIRGLR